jgi:(+)-trans-carveol dehydrogenase
MTAQLAGKVAFITGAARGQGRAHAVRLAEEGADIIALDICGPVEGRESVPASSADDLAETVRLVEALDRHIVAVQGDTRSFPDVTRALGAGLEEFGRVDIVVANAGTLGASTMAHQITEEAWRTTLDVNLTGVWHTVKAALPPMMDAGNGGSIVLISSGAGLRAMRHLADYAASKAAVIMLTKVLAIEYGRYRIRVNCISPGNVDTPMAMNNTTFALFRPDLDHPTKEDVRPVMESMSALRPEAWASPRDVANAAAWLCSDDASSVTGIVVPVDLGSSAK